MTALSLLEAFVPFLEDVVKDILLPVEDAGVSGIASGKAPDVYKLNLPEKTHDNKRFPYIVARIVTTKYSQRAGEASDNECRIRLIFGVYHDKQDEGEMAVMNLMTVVTTELLKKRMLVKRFQLANDLESVLYPNNVAPQFFGEMMTVWKLPNIEREVDFNV